MTKPKMTKLLADLLISNLAALAAYILLLMLLNFFTEGKLVMSTGALSSRGWDAADVAPAMRVLLTVAEVIFGAVALALVFLLSYVRLGRNTAEREAFLAEIGTAPYDPVAGRTHYMHRRGWYAVAVFVGVVLLLLIAEAVGVPFASFLITPETLLCHSLVNLLPLGEWARRVLIFLMTLALNMILCTVYHRGFAPRIYARWARERLRVEA